MEYDGRDENDIMIISPNLVLLLVSVMIVIINGYRPSPNRIDPFIAKRQIKPTVVPFCLTGHF